MWVGKSEVLGKAGLVKAGTEKEKLYFPEYLMQIDVWSSMVVLCVGRGAWFSQESSSCKSVRTWVLSPGPVKGQSSTNCLMLSELEVTIVQVISSTQHQEGQDLSGCLSMHLPSFLVFSVVLSLALSFSMYTACTFFSICYLCTVRALEVSLWEPMHIQNCFPLKWLTISCSIYKLSTSQIWREGRLEVAKFSSHVLFWLFLSLDFIWILGPAYQFNSRG